MSKPAPDMCSPESLADCSGNLPLPIFQIYVMFDWNNCHILPMKPIPQRLSSVYLKCGRSHEYFDIDRRGDSQIALYLLDHIGWEVVTMVIVHQAVVRSRKERPRQYDIFKNCVGRIQASTHHQVAGREALA